MKCANRKPLHFAKRETLDAAGSRAIWVVLLGVGFMLALSGPFGTRDLISFPERLIYWPLLCAAALFTAWFVNAWVGAGEKLARLNRGLRSLILGLAISLPVWVEVLLLNRLFFGPAALDPPGDLLILLRDVALIAIVFAGLLIIAGPWDKTRAQPTIAAPTETPPRLLARLPLDKRAALVSLSVQDHYTEVTTTAGRALVLLRLSDAIAEAEGVPGLQIHRSHWVTLAAVARVRRDGARVLLVLKDGRELPVSRTFMPQARQAGLL